MHKSGPVSYGLISSYLGCNTNVWVEPINIGTLYSIKWEIFVDESLASTETCADTKFCVQWYYGY